MAEVPHHAGIAAIGQGPHPPEVRVRAVRRSPEWGCAPTTRVCGIRRRRVGERLRGHDLPAVPVAVVGMELAELGVARAGLFNPFLHLLKPECVLSRPHDAGYSIPTGCQPGGPQLSQADDPRRCHGTSRRRSLKTTRINRRNSLLTGLPFHHRTWRVPRAAAHPWRTDRVLLRSTRRLGRDFRLRRQRQASFFWTHTAVRHGSSN